LAKRQVASQDREAIFGHGRCQGNQKCAATVAACAVRQNQAIFDRSFGASEKTAYRRI
jgi:hypothetical protein